MTNFAPIPLEIPTPSVLKDMRIELGLSLDALAAELGFTKNGADTVRAWESGQLYGKPFHPTPLAWRCLRLTVIFHRALSLPADAVHPYLSSNIYEEAGR